MFSQRCAIKWHRCSRQVPEAFLYSIYQVPSLQLAGRELATRYHSVLCVRPRGEHIPLPSSLTFPGSRWPVRPAGAQVPSPTELPFSAHANGEWAGVAIRSILGHTDRASASRTAVCARSPRGPADVQAPIQQAWAGAEA